MGKAINSHPTENFCIIGAGEILDYRRVSKDISPDAFIICADGGYDHCKGLNITPHLLMGDFDSITQQLPPHIPSIRLPVDKNYTDTAFAVEEAVSRGCKRLLLTGMLGGRLDHSLANLQSLGKCAALGLEAQITDGITQVLAFASGDATSMFVINPYPNHYFSILSLNGSCESVHIEGAVYPLDHYPLGSMDPRAISNEFGYCPVTITLTKGVVLMVITPKS